MRRPASPSTYRSVNRDPGSIVFVVGGSSLIFAFAGIVFVYRVVLVGHVISSVIVVSLL